MNKTSLSWAEKFALMAEYGPTDEAACATFEVTADELAMARKLKDVGTLSASTTFDAKRFGNPFGTSVESAGTATKHAPARIAKPETATKAVKVPQKRGRKGTKISDALRAIPETPVPVEEFRAQHGVSVAVLRQSKRFVSKLDEATRSSIGEVVVRQDKATKVLMIWRVASK